MTTLKGYAGKVLRANLTTGKIVWEELDPVTARLFIGGRGLGAKYLFDEVPRGTDPLGEDNKLYYLVGPLTGTIAQSASRWMVVTKSPLTGTFTRATGGADFGHQLKSAGIDVLVIEGKADKPVSLWISDDRVELKDASHIWGIGLDTNRLQEILKKESGDPKTQVACIGSAGENGTLFAAIMNGRRSASRGGVGTVMGSKNLKAVVVRGSQKIEIADPGRLKALTREVVQSAIQTEYYKRFSHLGTPGMTQFINNIGMLSSKNFQMGPMEDISPLTPEKLDEIFVKDESCFRCFIHCGSVFQVRKGPYRGDPVVAPEYETMWSFGENLCNTNLGFIVEANKICDDYGIDTISAGSVISFAMELYERGILTRNDLEGIDLTWGNHIGARDLLMKIVRCEGIGELLRFGTKRAAESIGKGAEKYAMHVKGLELPGYDPRSAKAHGLNIATSTIGASHMTGYARQEVFGFPVQVERFDVEGKGELTKFNQDNMAAYDSLILCAFTAGRLTDINACANLLVAATGIEEFADLQHFRQVGERIYNLEHAFNVREGFDRANDRFPERFLKEPVPNGPSKGQIFEMDPLLNDYYRARGWDIETGFPGKEKLEELVLKNALRELDSLGRVK